MKKKILFFVVLLMCVCFVPNVLAANITGCETILPGVNIDVKIANAVHMIVLAIQIAVPVLLVIFGMLDLFKAITAQKEDEIKKGQNTFIKRLIAAVIVFFVIAVVKLLISFASDDEGIMTCASCFLNGANKTTGVCNN